MKMPHTLKSSASFGALLILAAIALPRPAFAYIDPGTGSFVVQGIIAAVVGAGFAIKVFWNRIISAITGKSPVEDEDDE